MLDPERTKIANRKKAKCPICGKPSGKDHAPFCSARCRQVDLNRWLGETYRIPSHEIPSSDDPSFGE